MLLINLAQCPLKIKWEVPHFLYKLTHFYHLFSSLTYNSPSPFTCPSSRHSLALPSFTALCENNLDDRRPVHAVTGGQVKNIRHAK
jgi:hypothetical protein